MSDLFKAGVQLRELLRGVLDLPDPTVAGWGPRVDVSRLSDLYAPQKIKPFSTTPGGIDNLALSSDDTFLVPGKGELCVNFRGYFKVARENPTTNDWATADVYVNMMDIRLRGESKETGPITVRANPDFISAGQVFASGSARAAASCRIAAAVTFEIPGMGMTMFNKEPVLLMNDGINSVPPVEDPNGSAHLYKLPLFDMANPDGRPVAYITSLKYTVGNYLGRSEVEEIVGMTGGR